jgi:hypothetical protein
MVSDSAAPVTATADFWDRSQHKNVGEDTQGVTVTWHSVMQTVMTHAQPCLPAADVVTVQGHQYVVHTPSTITLAARYQ